MARFPKNGQVSERAERRERGQIIAMTVPLFIRLMEYAREDAKTDLDLHCVAERLSKEDGAADMDDYDELVKK